MVLNISRLSVYSDIIKMSEYRFADDLLSADVIRTVPHAYYLLKPGILLTGGQILHSIVHKNKSRCIHTL